MKRKDKLFNWKKLPVNQKDVQHVDRFFQLTDQKLAFDQHQLCKRMMALITMDRFMTREEVDELELATELCSEYREVISQRVANYEKQCTINQLDLFT